MKTRKIVPMSLIPVVLALCACGTKPQIKPDGMVDTDTLEKDPPTQPQEDYVGADAKVDPAVLVFKDETIGVRFEKLRDCFASDAGQEWVHYPLRKIGNFVQEDWCTGRGNIRNCAGGGFRGRPGDRWRSLSTLHYDSDWPEAFGLGALAGELPDDGDWGVRFAYYHGGKGIFGEGLHVSFLRYEGRESAGDVHLGDLYSYEVEETYCRFVSPLGKDGELEALIDSPESLKNTAIARFDELEEKVAKTIASGEARKCVYGPYKGGGIPPECTLTPLTEEEKKEKLGIARTRIGDQRESVAKNAELFHRLLTDLIDFERCW